MTTTQVSSQAAPQNRKMALWESLREIDKSFLTPYWEGNTMLTEINPMHGRSLMTSLFGPCGTGWGYDYILPDKPFAGLLLVKVSLWYKPHLIDKTFPEDFIAYVHEAGGAVMEQGDKHVLKKALTSGLQRCFMSLGHGSDIYAGFYRHEAVEEGKAASQPQPVAECATEEKPAQEEKEEDMSVQEPDEPRLTPVQRFIEALKKKEPLFEECSDFVVDDKVFFTVPVGTNDEAYEKLGFKIPKNKPGIYCKAFPISYGEPQHVQQ